MAMSLDHTSHLLLIGCYPLTAGQGFLLHDVHYFPMANLFGVLKPFLEHSPATF